MGLSAKAKTDSSTCLGIYISKEKRVQYITPSDGSLFEHLIQAFPDSSRSTLRSWVSHGRIQVNERKATRTDTKVLAGSLIELAPKPLPKEGPLRIHYEDRDIIVVEKPAAC